MRIYRKIIEAELLLMVKNRREGGGENQRGKSLFYDSLTSKNIQQFSMYSALLSFSVYAFMLIFVLMMAHR